MSINEILLRRKNKVTVVRKSAKALSDRYRFIATIMKNVETLGFTFSRELVDVLRTYNDDELEKFCLELVPMLKSLCGADVAYKPMYPNFPASVMCVGYSKLYMNAIFHYWSDGVMYPDEEKNERLPLFEPAKARVLTVGTEEELSDIFANLCASKTSLSMTDKGDIAWIFENMQVELPAEIPHKENAAYIAGLYLTKYPQARAEDVRKYMRTATDVLRLITVMSGGDVSLAASCRYRSFTRRERRMLLALLCGCGSIEEDMKRYGGRWIRVGERLHPSEYNANVYGKAIKAFDKLRNDVKIETFAGRLERALADADIPYAVSLLSQRPGEFARCLDRLLRLDGDADRIVGVFKGVAHEVSTPVLLQVREHFIHRNQKEAPRVFFPKGELAAAYSIPNTLPDIDEAVCSDIVSVCEDALVDIYKTRTPMGRVYLSHDLGDHIVPFSQRSAGSTLKTLVRGTRIPMQKDADTVRAFIWWTNTNNDKVRNSIFCNHSGRVDIDLTAAMFDENWHYMEHVSYTRLRSEQCKAYHSGDIVNGGPVDGKGVSEFLDVNISSAAECGARYIVYQVYNYTGQWFSDLPHAMFGWMNRQKPNSGEIYEPATVEQKMSLTSQSIVSIPVIFDCVSREIIWCDMSLAISACGLRFGGNNVESNLRGVEAACCGIVNMRKPHLYDLIDLNIRARGERVYSPEEADVVCVADANFVSTTDLCSAANQLKAMPDDPVEDACSALEHRNKRTQKIITPYDMDVIMADFI